MMSTPNQPRKKRRIDSQESREADVPPEVLPLVSPNEVKKSSKDPNRGMYPSKPGSKGKRNLSCPSFSNASKLLKGSKRSEDISLAEVSIKEEGLPQRKTHKLSVSPEEPKAHCSYSNPSAVSKKKLPKKKIPVVSFANKILNYFKPAPSTKKKGNEEAYSSSDDFQEASVSKGPEIPQPEAGKATGLLEVSKPEASNSSSDEKVEAFFKTFRDCYGLLGEEKEDDRPNYFEKLPCHVLETILCQIPYIDLMDYHEVCSTWDKVIGDPSFMEYKKSYYIQKMNPYPYFDPFEFFHMDEMCYMHLSANNCFSVLIKYMADVFGKTAPALNMYELLSKNHRAVGAELVLAERFPEVLKKESKAWSIFATAMLLSETVEDVYSLYRSVNKINLQTPYQYVLDAMYCVASFLIHFRERFRINRGLHYRVYNAIYWIENSPPPKDVEGSQSLRVPKGLPGQQSIHSYCDSSKSNLTFEQIRILNHCFQPDQVIKIVALAGTGKTTTLIHLAKLHPQVKYLNVMFNKAVCDDAKKRFPSNVTCRTAHSLAYAVYGNQLRSKLVPKIRPHDIVQHLKHNAGCSIQTYCYAKLVLSTIDKFVASVDREISLEHVPNKIYEPERELTDIERPKILKDATEIWEKMIDKNNKNLRITHDTYLKLFQLSKPKFTEYQCIMVDEAQDCNPAMLDIVMSQKLPVILVGDPNQQIYGFRGAKNALDSFSSTHIYHLTKSFRFGPEIAYIASCCLEVLNDSTDVTIVGTNKPSTMEGKVEGQYAVLARSNVQLFNEAIRLCCLGRYRSYEPSNIQGCFAGGIRGYGFDQMLDIYKLSSDSAAEVSDKFISKFRSYKDLCNYAKGVDDNDLLAKIDLVNQHSADLPEYIKTIKEKCSHPMELANVVFSTVHKSKGLEFDTVSLTDDFLVLPNSEHRSQTFSASEENNILYVALTRAKRSLFLPDELMRVLLLAQEKFEYPKLASNVLGGATELECITCRDIFTPHTKLVMVRRRIVLGNGRVIQGGPLCVKCGTEPTFRPRVTVEPVVMYLDPCDDVAHRSMTALVGPLPSDPPIVHETAAFNEMDVVYVINLQV